MIGKEPFDETVEFEVNGVKCGCDGNLVWRVNEDGQEEDIGCFEDIKFLEQTSHCAVFYSECLDEYLHFYGYEFKGINEIQFQIVPAHHEEDLPQMLEMWEQVRVFIDGDDIINQIGSNNSSHKGKDHHWGVESSCFLAQKDGYYKGKLLIGICTCTTEGDDDIVVDIDNSDNYVSWKIYHVRNSELQEICAFEKRQYEKALEEAKTNITKKEEDAHKWAFLLHYAKKELENKIRAGK
jgi:hypothetical protein